MYLVFPVIVIVLLQCLSCSFGQNQKVKVADMDYDCDCDYDNDKKQDTKSVLQYNINRVISRIELNLTECWASFSRVQCSAKAKVLPE